jgi:(p)ppGpp synthase/HD superfamily hydrolase
MDIIQKAFNFAYEKHKPQKRKCKDVLYIVHPMDVASILMKNGASDELVAAGFLHDVVEDNEYTGVTEEQLRKEFGDEITDLVMNVTEREKARSWEERKQQTIKKLETAPREIKILKCADKLANLMDLLEDCREHGEKVWGKFGAPKEKQLEYCHGVLKNMDEIKELTLYREYAKRVKELEKIVNG